MLNFLYCFDENYNIQGLVSIYSLLDNISEKINIHIIHKDPSTLNKYIVKIQNHTNLNNLKIFKFNNTNFSFPRVEGAHVSEATYYRFFIEKFIDPSVENLIYLDSDIVCISDPLDDIKSAIHNLNNSNFIISVRSEPQSLSKELDLKSGKYFNAGVMIIRTSDWYLNKLESQLIKLTEKYKDILQFWDQDVLNKYFDGDYLELNKYLNFSLNMKPFEHISKIDTKDIKFIHYVGKFKPWSLRGIVNNKSEFYQKYYRNLFLKKYHLHSSRKLNTIRDLIGSIRYGVFLNTKYPINLFFKVFLSLIKIKK